MNKTNMPEPDLDNLLKRSLKDDLPPDAEARMSRQFTKFKRTLDRTEQSPEPDRHWWMSLPFQKEFLAVASAVMIIMGLGIQIRGPQNALAHSIEQLKVFVPISASLNRVSSMDCTVLKTDDKGEQTSYRIRWIADGDVRLDMDLSDNVQTLWISKETISIACPGSGPVHSMSRNSMAPGPVWQPVIEFMSPVILAKQMQGHYELMQSGRINEFLISGQEGLQDIEIVMDAKTYLPKVLKKYSMDLNRTNGTRNCLMEVRFFWNQPIPAELFIPRTPAAER
jgi:hypothetical protein